MVRLYCQQVAQILTVWLVGKIACKPEPSTNTSSNSPSGIIQSILPSTSKTEPGVTNKIELPEPQPLTRPDLPQQSVSPRTQEVVAVASSSIEEHISYPPASESPKDADPTKPRGDRDATTVSAVPLHPRCTNNIPLADLIAYRISSG